MSSKRRREFLPISDQKFKVYHETFDSLRMASHILTPSDRISISTQFMDHKGMLGLLAELTGDEDGDYLRNGQHYLALIPGTERKLQVIENNWQKYQRQCKDEGRRAPEESSSPMWEQKLKALAALDVQLEEKALLEQRLKVLSDAEQAKEDLAVLEYGTIGSSQNCGSRSSTPNVIKTMDNQKCDWVNDTLCVVDDRSPYSGMALYDYRDLVDSYRAAQREAGKSILHKIDKKDLPEWPKGVKNHLEKKPEKV